MHDYVEMVFIAHGSCFHVYHNTDMMLIPGDVLVVLPNEEHSYSINSRTMIYNCLFYPCVLGEDWNALLQSSGFYNLFTHGSLYRTKQDRQEILHLNPAASSYIESILKNMLHEQHSKSSNSQLVQKANLIILISMLGRAWEHQFKDHTSLHNEKRNMIAGALDLIDKFYFEELTVEQLAASVFMSVDNFRKVFKEMTGLSPVDYVNKVRISKAVNLLEDKKITVARAAEMVGINDVNYFSRLFKKKLGCSPTEFRK